jgi:hypothetical protein
MSNNEFRSKEYTEKRTAEPQNIEYRMSKGGILSIVLKRQSAAIPSFDIRYSLFVIRYSAVRFSTPSNLYPSLIDTSATTYANTLAAAICGIPQLIAIWAAIMADRTEAQPLTDQA